MIKLRSFKLYDGILITVFLFFLFCLLTNLIPLIQIGWMNELKSKTRYANTTRISFAVFLAFFSFFCLSSRSFIQKSSFLKAVKTICFVNSFGFIVFLTFFYFLSTCGVSMTRHWAIETRAFDLGIFSQALWNTLNGNILFSSIKDNICLLGDHFQPLQLLALPLYWTWPSPQSLLALQSLSMSMCIPLIYIYAKRITGQTNIAVVFAIAFFLFLPSRCVLHEDYHPEVMGEPLFILAFLFFQKNQIKALFLTLICILLAKENMAGIIFIAGMYVAIFEKKIRLGSALALIALVYFFVITHYVIPQISGAPYLYTGNFNNIFSNPLAIFKAIFSEDTISYIGKLFLPFGFLSFFHLPTLIFCLPILMQNLLSENDAMRSFNYHYTIGLAPFVIISAIHGWNVLKTKSDFFNKREGLMMALILILSVFRSGPAEYYYFYNSHQSINEHTREIRNQLSKIDSKYSVLTHNNLIAQSINRKYIYQFDYNSPPTKIEQVNRYKPDFVFTEENFWEPGTSIPNETYEQFLSGGYQLVYKKDSFRIFSKIVEL
jgi:uncharacterized membrane protein